MSRISSNKAARLAAAAMALIVVGACNNDDILLSYQHTVQVGLYSTHTHNDTTLTNVVVQGYGSDSLLYDVSGIGSMFLNMNLNADTTAFMFRTQTLQDDITFSYTKHVEPVSGSSGMAMQIHIDTIAHTNTFIDSVAIVNANVNYNESLENVQIYIY